MAPVRLVPARRVDGWRADVHAAMTAAERRQRAAVASRLRASGLTWASPLTDATGQAWDQDAWTDTVADVLEPAVRRVAAEIQATVRAAVVPAVSYGMPDLTDMLAGLVTSRAVTGGEYLGGRLGLTAADRPRYGGVVHPAAQSTVLDEYQARFQALDQLASNVAGTMSNAALQVLAETATARTGTVSYTWNCSMLPTSRDEHVDADGQPQAAGDPFDVGGESLMYPGDPAGSDWNVCNCLCWLELDGVEATGDTDVEEEEAG